jgi:hypothetical protein
MTARSELDRSLAAWMADEPTRAPREPLDRAIVATAGIRPRPAPLATFGSHWLEGAAAREDVLAQVVRPGLAVAAVAILIVLALIAAAVVASQPERHVPGSGALAYGRDGDVFLVPAPGAAPIRIADGNPTGGPRYGDPRWSPNGRFLLFGYYENEETTVKIVDPEGRPVASFPGWLPSWSPDSTRTAAWEGPGIGIHSVRGDLLQMLLIPPEVVLSGDVEPSWTGSGDGIVLKTWVVPLDPTVAPRHVNANGWRGLGYGPNGRLAVAALGGGLSVADTEGLPERRLDVPPGLYEELVWSPTGDRLAVGWSPTGERYDPTTVAVVDPVSSTLTRLLDATAGGSVHPVRWSPDGRSILVEEITEGVPTRVWKVAADGSGSELLVETDIGSGGADWQPAGEVVR